MSKSAQTSSPWVLTRRNAQCGAIAVIALILTTSACFADPTEVGPIEDDSGVATGTPQDPSAGQASTSGAADCEGTPLGLAELDECGVCEGDGSMCADCMGVPNGGATVDVCDVCDGDGSSCADCMGVPNGDAVADECGVCDGMGAPCWGCTTPSASNYDPLATIDDGACTCDPVGPGVADQSNLSSNAGFGNTSQWQSFTVGISGGLDRIDLGVSSPLSGEPSPGTITVYAGEGVAGQTLGSQDIVLEPVFNMVQQFEFDTLIPMTAGEVYTYQLTVPSINVGFVDVGLNNPYAGGQAGTDVTHDLVFRMHIAQCAPGA